jgi:hypothetical protein
MGIIKQLFKGNKKYEYRDYSRYGVECSILESVLDTNNDFISVRISF